MNESSNRVFELCKLYLQSLDTYDFTNEKWVMTGLKEARRLFGLLSHKCPLCETPTRFYTILCKAKDASGEPVGKENFLPLYTKYGGFLTFLDLSPRGNLQFSICPNGHETARIMVNSGGGDGFNGYLVHQYEAKRWCKIACP